MRGTVFLFVAVMAMIVVIDYWLGARAEYLNAYEILRRTFRLPLSPVSETYIVGQEAAGRFALGWAWLLWLVESSIVTLVLLGACGGIKTLFCKLVEVCQ